MSPNITYKWKHVLGHQYGQPDYEMNFWEQLNVRADILAKSVREQIEAATDFQAHWDVNLPGERWQILLNGCKVYKHPERMIRDFIDKNIMRKYWHKRRKIDTLQFDNVNWEAIGLAMKEISPSRRQWLSKHASGMCGVNATLVQWKEKTEPACPRCGEYENATHVWHCTTPDTQSIWQTQLDIIHKWMQSQDTDPDIVSNFIMYVKDGHTTDPLDPSDEVSPILLAQDLIGWKNIIEGLFSNEWQLQQASHYKKRGSLRSARRWQVNLIKHTWNIAWALWQDRNDAEHKNDQTTETEKVDEEIRSIMSWYQESPNPIFAELFQVALIEQVTAGTLHVKKSWVQNLTAAKNRFDRRSTTTNELQGMRNVMARFLLHPAL
jgi:hypothetical protein